MASISFLPAQDTYISEWYKNRNFASSPALFLGQYQQPGDSYRSLLQFDLNAIPPACTIEKAELKLNLYRNEVAGANTMLNVHRLLNNWSQPEVNWENQPPFDYSSDVSLSISSNEQAGPISINITHLARGWYDGSIPNSGLLLMGDETENALMAFSSKDYVYNSEWPRLIVHFVDGILEDYQKEVITIPGCPEYPIIESRAIPLGARKKATFMILNNCSSPHIKVKVQVGYDDCPDSTFFDAGPWYSLNPNGYPGEAIALSTSDAAEFARVLIQGEGGESLYLYQRTKES